MKFSDQVSIPNCPLRGIDNVTEYKQISQAITIFLKTGQSWGFYIPFNSQGPTGTGPQLCHLWDDYLKMNLNHVLKVLNTTTCSNKYAIRIYSYKFPEKSRKHGHISKVISLSKNYWK